MNLQPYPFTEEEIAQRIAAIQQNFISDFIEQELCRKLVSFIDLTTLEGSDNRLTVENLCRKAMEIQNGAMGIPTPAAICIYTPFVAYAKKLLEGTDIHVATVVGCFPSGQAPIALKLQEAVYAIDQGADELDLVISRGTFLAGNYQEVWDEIAQVRTIASNVPIKVILETGELKSADNIYKASQIAMSAGADFIKTSTGKIAESATPRSLMVMCDAIKMYENECKKKIGIKPAGGISDFFTASLFANIIIKTLGKSWFDKQLFRIGTSRFVDVLLKKII